MILNIIVKLSNKNEWILYFYLSYRSHKESLVKLRKLLSDSSKNIRHRRHLINIHISALAWMAEFLGFFLIFLGSFILGNGNAIVTLILQSFSLFIYFDLLPCIYLINDSDFKANFAETQIYFKFLRFFNCERVDSRFLKNEANEQDEQKKSANKPNNWNRRLQKINFWNNIEI